MWQFQHPTCPNRELCQKCSQPNASLLSQIKIPPDEGVRHHNRLKAAVNYPTAVSVLQTATASSLCTAYKQTPGLQLRWVLTQTHCPVLSLCTVHMVSMPGAGSPACHFILFSLAACSSGDSAFFLLCITCLGTPAHFQHTQCLVTQHTKSSSLIETVLGCIDTGCKLCTRKLAAGSDLKFVYLTALCLLARKDQSFI